MEVLAGWQTGCKDHTWIYLASLLITGVAWVLWCYRDHAVFTTPIHGSVPILPAGKPLLGHTASVLGNMNRIHHWLLDSSQRMGFRTFAFSLPTLPTFYMVSSQQPQ